MGKVIFTPFQQMIFDYLSKDTAFKNNYYLGGGTALSVFHLQHRRSDDLDFFTIKKFDKKYIIDLINQLAKDLELIQKATVKKTVIWFELIKKTEHLKVDFLDFHYPEVDKKIQYQGITVDSSLDIGANKLLLSTIDVDVKNFVDLYFLLQEKYTIWDLIYAVEEKYKLKLDIIALGKNFYQIDEIELLPKMLKPLTLAQLKLFFKDLSLSLGKKIIKE